MGAKLEVIREIEEFWGKNWTRQYVPKVRRPLVKRPPGPKRKDAQRFPQNDPRQWQPAVLKAVLMVARKCDEKPKLRRLMNEAVEYRIKHTGNLKPQLVTTDFDVIDDVVEKGWSVPQAFSIRYKHLTGGRTYDDDDDADGGQDQHAGDEGDDGEGEVVDDGESYDGDEEVVFKDQPSSFQESPHSYHQQQHQNQQNQYYNPYGRSHLKGKYQKTPPQPLDSPGDRRRTDSGRDRGGQHQQQQHRQYQEDLQYQQKSQYNHPHTPSNTSPKKRQHQPSPTYNYSGTLLSSYRQQPHSSSNNHNHNRTSNRDSATKPTTSPPIKRDAHCPTPDPFPSNQPFPTPDTATYADAGTDERPADDDDEFMKAQLDLLEAKERRAELKLQMLARKRMKNM
ncbi:hypothetical protein BCR34DRAFT_205249 [Clohesyomyces aquaticus]|uniref:Uncharacterized protein n=1 Tax=Clohesyomyces aquaticus TaxID=1231657 RepID=A0A1Y1YA37_9PLEO|nr:hypothetical protein BCR34DRAFT_205249 [Clohesyomyces aquaticus]